jgi:hypothetical protein
MFRTALLVLAPIALVGAPAHADNKADRAALADSLTKLANSAGALAKTAKSSDDRGARKRFAPAAQELSDDLAALARRISKDVPLKTLGKDVAGIEKDAGALVELADEAEDKAERKSLRGQASLLQQAIAGMRKSLDAIAAKEAGKDTPQPVAKFTGRLVNNTDKCNWPENVKFVLSRNGTQVFATQMVFPGRDQPLVLESGQYAVQVLDTSSTHLASITLNVNKENWTLISGCVKDKD